MNNILQHFATAYFDHHLKGDQARQVYFDVVPSGTDAVHAVDREGRELAAHTYWKGFKRGTAVASPSSTRRPRRPRIDDREAVSQRSRRDLPALFRRALALRHEPSL